MLHNICGRRWQIKVGVRTIMSVWDWPVIALATPNPASAKPMIIRAVSPRANLGKIDMPSAAVVTPGITPIAKPAITIAALIGWPDNMAAKSAAYTIPQGRKPHTIPVIIALPRMAILDVAPTPLATHLCRFWLTGAVTRLMTSRKGMIPANEKPSAISVIAANHCKTMKAFEWSIILYTLGPSPPTNAPAAM